MCMQDPTSATPPRSPDRTFFSRSGNSVLNAPDHAGIAITVSVRPQHALLDWILVTIDLSAVWLSGFVTVNGCRPKRHCPIVRCVYAPFDCAVAMSKTSSAKNVSYFKVGLPPAL